MNVEFSLDELNLIKADMINGKALDLINAKIARLDVDQEHIKRTWAAYCGHFNLKPEDFGRKFKIKSRMFQVIGLNPGAPAFPVRAIRLPDGKEFRCPASQVR